MMNIAENINEIRRELPEGIRLVAVSKTKPNEQIMEAYEVGQRIFGENKVQDLTRKYDELPKDIEWHYIGHLQRNKVKFIAPFISLIHAVDSLRLLQKINDEALKNNRIIPCLFQIHIADEDTKFGMSKPELEALLKSEDYKKLKAVKIEGLMGMATYTQDKNQIRAEFNELAEIFNSIKTNFFLDNPDFKELSIGMSGDYKIAVECGSTMVRVGSKIFGARI